MFGIGTAPAFAEPVVSLPTDFGASVGGQIVVPITITGVSGAGIGAYALRLDYDTTILSNPIAVDAGTLSEGNPGLQTFSPPSDGIGDFSVGIGFGFTPSGDGILIKVQFDVSSVFTGTIPITFASKNNKTVLSTAGFVSIPSTFNDGSLVAIDDQGPVTSTVAVSSNNIPEATASIVLTGKVDDSAEGNNNIKAAEYFVGAVGSSGTGIAMDAVDGIFNSPTENVTTTVDTSGWTMANSPYTLTIHGQDAQDNWGDTQIVQVTVYSPVDAPTFNPGTGTYNIQQDVTPTLATGATTNYYTLDGSAPDNTATVYTAGDIAIDGNNGDVIVLKMVSYDAAGNQGVTGTATYTFDKVGPVAPTFDIGTDTYNVAQDVTPTLAGDAAATYYTLDGSDPDNTKTAYTSGTVAVDGADGVVVTLKMVSYDAVGNRGSVGTATYTFDKVGPVAPTFDIGTDTYNVAQDVTPTLAGDAAATYYTLDGSDPDNTKTAYTSGTVAVDGADGVDVTLKMVSYDTLGNKGTVATATYTFDKVGPVAPTFDIGTGSYNAAQNVTPTLAEDADATYYTLDGSDPDNTKTAYTSGTVAVDGADGVVVTLKMVSYDAIGNMGTVGTAIYTFDKIAPTPAITAPGSDSYVTSASYSIQGTAVDGTGSGVSKVEVSIDNGTTWNEAAINGTWSYAATLAQGANVIKVKATDTVGNVSDEITGSTLTYYPPLAISVDGQDVTDGEIYVPQHREQ